MVVVGHGWQPVNVDEEEKAIGISSSLRMHELNVSNEYHFTVICQYSFLIYARRRSPCTLCVGGGGIVEAKEPSIDRDIYKSPVSSGCSVWHFIRICNSTYIVTFGGYIY